MPSCVPVLASQALPTPVSKPLTKLWADAKLPITPAKLATRALTGYPTALRWLKIHHPEVLKPDATVAAEQAKPTHAETVQKQPDTTPGDHDSAKAQKPAKRLRNTENEPF